MAVRDAAFYRQGFKSREVTVAQVDLSTTTMPILVACTETRFLGRAVPVPQARLSPDGSHNSTKLNSATKTVVSDSSTTYEMPIRQYLVRVMPHPCWYTRFSETRK